MVALFSLALGLLFAVFFQLHWSWWLVPLGVPAVTFWHSYGLVVFVGFLRLRAPSHEEINRTPRDQLITRIAIALVAAASTGLGWAVHTWGMAA